MFSRAAQRAVRSIYGKGRSMSSVNMQKISILSASAYGSNSDRFSASSFAAASVVALGLASVWSEYSHAQENESGSISRTTVYRRSEIAKHNKIDDCWVTLQGNVYDITTFVRNHPGGHEKIMLAAGGDLESFWNIYRQHYNSATPLDILSRLQIGVLHTEDFDREQQEKDKAEEVSADPYARDPVVDPRQRILSLQPINSEPPANLLTANHVTPSELFFVRNHHPVPLLDADSFSVSVSVENLDRPKERSYTAIGRYSLTDLQQLFPEAKEVTATIQCGGNRRLEMTQVEKTNGASWQVGAISTAKWSGVSLREFLIREVLSKLQISEESVYSGESPYQHVHFVGADGMEASVPLWRALQIDGDALLATDMNGTALPAEHGYPLRAVIPGHVGVRNVKWVTELRVSREEAYGAWQRGMAYKGFAPGVRSLEGVDVEQIPSLQQQPVQSAITSLRVGNEEVRELQRGQPFTLSGYAYSGGGRGIVRVDVSLDGGRSWHTASLHSEGAKQPIHRAWAWTLWTLSAEVPTTGCDDGVLSLAVKATDASYNVQPDDMRSIWNLRGINNNAWHRIRVPVRTQEQQ